MQKIYITYLLLLGTLSAWAQGIHVNAPQHVGVDEQFRVSYSISTQDVQGFRGGAVPDGLEVLMGPSLSSQTSYQYVNGHASSSSSITYTYIIYAGKAGTYTIGPAHAKVGGHDVASSSVKITVSGSARSGSSSSQYSGGGNSGYQQSQQQVSANGHVSDGDIFIRVTANKTTIKEQEPVLLTYKVYAKTGINLTQLEGKMPDLNGFHTQEIQLPRQKSFHMENLDGRPYLCCTWSQYVMYPQKTGKLEIPQITFKGIVAVENRSVDPFEAFFNGGSNYIEVKKDIIAKGMNINVEPLPEKPAGFSGGVGTFTISGQLLKSSVKANDAATIRVVISGNGNLKLLKQPEAQWPKDFDKYDTKVTDKTKLTDAGLEGNMVYDIIAAPKNQGDYDIPAIEFTYYDTQENRFKTIKTEPFKLHVDAADSNSSDKPEQEDILSLKTGDETHLASDNIYGTTAYWVVIAAILLIFISLIWIFRKRALERADIVRMRGKKANKVATKRLKRAANLMKQKKEAEFYDEVLRALWGYVSDKLNIPTVELSRDNITEKLSSHDVDEESISSFVSAIDECEYARYAPGEAQGKMNTVYDKAAKAITDIDKFLNKKKVMPKSSATVIILLMMCACSLSANALTKSDADKDYSKGNYVKAISEYKQLLRQTPSAEIYYNLGNAYFRCDSLAQAVLAYERAYKINPSDDDIRGNLHFVRTKTIDKMQSDSDVFIVAWWQSMANTFSLTVWAIVGVISLILVVGLFLVYLFADAVWLRKTGFFGGILMFIVFVLCNILALYQKSIMDDESGAIVIQAACPVKKSPEQKSSEVCTIHEATHVTIDDDSAKGWYEVTLDDGRKGWIESKNVERI